MLDAWLRGKVSVLSLPWIDDMVIGRWPVSLGFGPNCLKFTQCILTITNYPKLVKLG
jgi:hypothetical protein